MVIGAVCQGGPQTSAGLQAFVPGLARITHLCDRYEYDHHDAVLNARFLRCSETRASIQAGLGTMPTGQLYRTHIAGYRLSKAGEVVPDVRRLSVSQRLRRTDSKRMRVAATARRRRYLSIEVSLS